MPYSTAPASWVEFLAVRAAGAQAALHEHPGPHCREESGQPGQPGRDPRTGAPHGSLDVVALVAGSRNSSGSSPLGTLTQQAPPLPRPAGQPQPVQPQAARRQAALRPGQLRRRDNRSTGRGPPDPDQPGQGPPGPDPRGPDQQDPDPPDPDPPDPGRPGPDQQGQDRTGTGGATQLFASKMMFAGVRFCPWGMSFPKFAGTMSPVSPTCAANALRLMVSKR